MKRKLARKIYYGPKSTNPKLIAIEKQYGRDFGTATEKEIGEYLRKKGYPEVAKFMRL